jgi:hypothetical protein
MMPDAHVERIIRNRVLLLGNPILRRFKARFGNRHARLAYRKFN